MLGAAVFFGLLYSGRGFMNAMTEIPPEIADSIIAIIIYFAATSILIERLYQKWKKVNIRRSARGRGSRSMWATLEQIFPYAIVFTIPSLITALGALFSERSGVVNIGLDGLMIVGSFMSAFVIFKAQAIWPEAWWVLWVGLLAAMVIGILFSCRDAFASINLSANQIISGTAINLIAGALTVFLARNMTGSGNIRITTGFIPGDVPGLSAIPVIGDLVFSKTYPTTWLVLLIVAASAFVLYKTPFGLRLRACGEHPHAAEVAGIRVKSMRYVGVMISGAFSGLGVPSFW